MNGEPPDHAAQADTKINLDKFANLDEVSVTFPRVENFTTLRSILYSWKPKAIHEPRLSLVTFWDDIRSGIDGDEEHGLSREFSGLLESFCGTS